MALNDFFDDGQPQATTVAAVGGAHKTLKHARLVGLGDAGAVVHYLQQGAAFIAAHAHRDLSARAACIVQRVVDHIAQGFADQQGVGQDPDGRRWRGIAVRQSQVHTQAKRARHPFGRQRLRQAVQVKTLAVLHHGRLGLGPGQGEQLIHQMGAARGAVVHPLQACAQLGVRGGLQSDFGLTFQAGQWRAQLVRGVANEAFLRGHVALHRRQQGVDGRGQCPDLTRRRGQLQRRQIGGRSAFHLLAQARQRRQTGANAQPHDQRHQQDQPGHGQHVDQDAPRQLFAVGAAARHLHQHGLRGGAIFAKMQIQSDQPQWLPRCSLLPVAFVDGHDTVVKIRRVQLDLCVR